MQKDRGTMTDPQAAVQNVVQTELCWHHMPLYCPPVYNCMNQMMPIMSLSFGRIIFYD